jgi:hypothetical protein
MRFERVFGFVGSGRLRNRHGQRAADRADFLARLWALFGPPDAIAGGFSYALLDQRTGLRFTAYSAVSGPAFGGLLGERPLLLDALSELEALLEDTPPADCELRIWVESEYGRGAALIGSKGGQTFDRALSFDQEDLPAILAEAEAALQRPPGEPLAEFSRLEDLRMVLANSKGRPIGSRERLLAQQLWLRSFESFESWLPARGAPGAEVDILPDWLLESAQALGIDFPQYAERHQAMSRAALRIRLPAPPPD